MGDYMENAIKYYYSMSPNNIEKCENGYIFEYNDETYYLENCLYSEKRVKEVYELNKVMINNQILVHEILLNNFKQIATTIDDKIYILMRININLNKKIDLKDIAYFHHLSSLLVNTRDTTHLFWGNKWSKKVDYYEQQAIEIGKKYPIAMETFNYFIGIAENAITYINDYKMLKPTIAYCHIRTSSEALDFYNPFNLLIDYKVRDVSEYIKYNFFNSNINYNEVAEYILNSNLSPDDIKYFYARMLFPTYYFDVFEKVMENLEDEVKIAYIANKISDYEKFLNYLCRYLNRFTMVEELEWIKKAINQH